MNKLQRNFVTFLVFSERPIFQGTYQYYGDWEGAIRVKYHAVLCLVMKLLVLIASWFS